MNTNLEGFSEFSNGIERDFRLNSDMYCQIIYHHDQFMSATAVWKKRPDLMQRLRSVRQGLTDLSVSPLYTTPHELGMRGLCLYFAD